MKKIILLLIAGLFIFNNSNAQTFVSGGIYSNTTWTLAGSPYIITGDVVIFSGDTLTIQPGVVVKFDDHVNIDVRGGLYANGTSTDSIIFTSNNVSPYAGIYSGINRGTLFSYCRFSYGDTAIAYPSNNTISHCLFNSDFVGVLWGYNSFDTCIFKYDSAGIWCSGSGRDVVECEFLKNSCGINGDGGMFDSIIHSTFFNNNTAVTGVVAGNAVNSIIDSNRDYGLAGLVHITGCTLKYNGVGTGGDDESTITSNIISNNGVGINSINSTIELNTISDNSIGIETWGDKISCNSICNNTLYNIKSWWSGNELANNNYWCLSDSAAIQATIYDAYQDISLGLVFFTPFDTIACTITTDVKELTFSSEQANLFPNPNNGNFTIQSSGISGKSPVEIYNMLGEIIYKSTISQPESQIKLNTRPGVYLYRIVSETGNLIGTGKFVIE